MEIIAALKRFPKTAVKYDDEKKVMEKSDTISYPKSSLDGIFHEAVNVERVKDALRGLIAEQRTNGSRRLLWFIMHKVLTEIDWLNDSKQTSFIKWVTDVYGWEWKTKNFKQVDSNFKRTLTTAWDENTVKDRGTGRRYRDFANCVRSRFVDVGRQGEIDDKREFLNRHSDGTPMYIYHRKA